MVIAGSEEGITMIEAGAKEVSKQTSPSLENCYEFILKTIQTQKAIISQWGKRKRIRNPRLFFRNRRLIRNNYHLKLPTKLPFLINLNGKTINLLYKQEAEEATPTLRISKGLHCLGKIVKENIQDLL